MGSNADTNATLLICPKSNYSMKKYFFLVIPLIFTIILASVEYPNWTDNPKENVSLVNKAAEINNSPLLQQQKSDNLSSHTKEKHPCNKQQAQITSDKPIQSRTIDEERANEILAAGYENPSTIIEKARAGDGTAAIAIYSVLSSCYPLGTPITSEEKKSGFVKSKIRGCPSLPTVIFNDRLSLLETTASNGDADAQLVYAMNAPVIANFYRSQNTNEAAIYAKAIIAKSEMFGAAAAREGIKDAYQFMARSYQTGVFGSQNWMRAYAYTLVIENVEKSKNTSKILDNLRKNLSSEEIIEAKELAFGCQEKYNESIISSPFK